MSDAFLGHGSTVARGDETTATNFVAISEVRSFDGPDEEVSQVEVTHLQSPGGYRERIPGLKDGGQLTMTLNFVPGDATQDHSTGLIYDFQNDITRYYRITWDAPVAYTATFRAFVMRLGPRTPVDDAVTQQLTVQIAGAIAYA